MGFGALGMRTVNLQLIYSRFLGAVSANERLTAQARLVEKSSHRTTWHWSVGPAAFHRQGGLHCNGGSEVAAGFGLHLNFVIRPLISNFADLRMMCYEAVPRFPSWMKRQCSNSNNFYEISSQRIHRAGERRAQERTCERVGKQTVKKVAG
jgi:hypothetical protein